MIIEIFSHNTLTSKRLETAVGTNEQAFRPVISNLLFSAIFFEHRPSHEDTIPIEEPIKRQVAHILSGLGAFVDAKSTRLETTPWSQSFDEAV